MGIGSDVIDLVAELRLKKLLPLGTSVLEVGAQQLSSSFLSADVGLGRLAELFNIETELRFAPPKEDAVLVHGDLPHLSAQAPAARQFWMWLGFRYMSIDIDGSHDSICMDLNYDEIPPESVGKFGLVTNFGTTEHVANQLNAFKVIHDATALGGLMIHQLPAQGYLNHGLINYNYKFFWMLARSNGYRIVDAGFSCSDATYELPANIVEFVGSYSLRAHQPPPTVMFADSGIHIVLQKVLDIKFVPPLDVPTGSTTPVKEFKDRYWTVYDMPAFEAEIKKQALINEIGGHNEDSVNVQ